MYKLPILVMETGVNAVTAGGNTAGWVSGNPASQAATTAITVIFDLGPQWLQYPTLVISLFPSGASSSFETVTFTGSDTAAANTARRLVQFGASTVTSAYLASAPTTGGAVGVMTRPMGRFVTVGFSINATNATDANAKVVLAAYPV